MSIYTEILTNVDSFIKTATNFVELIERNVDSYYKLKDKTRARRQLECIDRVIDIFPQILFYNGLFAASFFDDVSGADHYTKTRDNPILEEFQKVLDNAEATFDAAAPQIQGLGSDMVLIFKRQIALRRTLVADAKQGKLVGEQDVRYIYNKLHDFRAVEWRFRELSQKYRNDAILETASKDPSLSEEELAQKFDTTEMVVRNVISNSPKHKSVRKPGST